MRAHPSHAAVSGRRPAPATLTTSCRPDKDGDCAAHYPGLPVAYRVDGGTFQDREPVVRGRGCQKRDVSRTWTSMCCKS